MRGNDSNKELEQLSLWDVLQMADSPGVELSSEDLEAAIVKLQEWKSCAKRREKKEKEKHEREEAERKAREEKERKEAHIQEVTCMDLPLDWNNVFNFDVRTQGVHTDSIPDALIISLATLGNLSPFCVKSKIPFAVFNQVDLILYLTRNSKEFFFKFYS